MGGQMTTSQHDRAIANTSTDSDIGQSAGVQESLSMKMVIRGLKMKWPSVRCMETHDLHQRMDNHDQSLIILDARPEDEFEVSHIARAQRVHPDAADLDEVFQELKSTYGNEELTVVCYCSVGYRSSLYANALNKKIKQDQLDGHIRVYNLEGSIFKWANENRPMVDSSGTVTTLCHPYSATWGKLLNPQRRYSGKSPT